MAMKGSITSKRLQAVATGGNHLANVLVKYLGGDFAKHFPPKSDPDTVRAAMAEPLRGDAETVYDVWVAWAAIMNARHLMGDRTAKPEKVYEPCPTCRGSGKTAVLKMIEGEMRASGREIACTDCKGQGRKVATPAT